MKFSVRLLATGSYVPDKVLSNADLQKLVDTNDEWIFSRTGIRERRILEEGLANSDMALVAAQRAYASAITHCLQKTSDKFL